MRPVRTDSTIRRRYSGAYRRVVIRTPPDHSLRVSTKAGQLHTELLRSGARRLIEAAVTAEVEEFLGAFEAQKLGDGRRRVVRNGHLPERQLLTGIGAVDVRVPKARSRAGSPVPSATVRASQCERRSGRSVAVPARRVDGQDASGGGCLGWRGGGPRAVGERGEPTEARPGRGAPGVVPAARSTSMDSAFCIKALAAAPHFGVPEVFNTDQGVQFTSLRAFTDRVRACGARCSMDGRGRYLDNIFIERLWRSLKYEAVCQDCQKFLVRAVFCRNLIGSDLSHQCNSSGRREAPVDPHPDTPDRLPALPRHPLKLTTPRTRRQWA